MDDELMTRLRAAAEACDTTVFWHARRTPAQVLRAVADAAEELELDEWDVYAERGPVAQVEKEVAELLGKPAAAFFPSGIMAQQAALRVWCDRTGSRRVAIPDLSHLLKHEDDGPRRVHGFEFEYLTTGRVTATADDMRSLSPGLGAALIELPLRDAGCLLPSWDDLTALSEAARELGCPLHADGARIWESQAFYDKPLSEIAALVDTIYVSFYKGLEALAGAALAGPEDVVDEARRWRKRMGGTLFHLTPYAVSALAGLRDRLPRMGEYAAWARKLAAELSTAGLRVTPDPPHTNTFLVYAEGDPDAITERVIGFMEREKIQPCGGWWEAPVPGVAMSEVAVHDAALEHDPAQVAGWITEVAGV
ncbi:MAG: threonine aldolase [Nocardioides sp.]|nr:threonine aldolase [Nocardioides sp.]